MTDANGSGSRADDAANPAQRAVGSPHDPLPACLEDDGQKGPAQDLQAGLVVRDRRAGNSGADEKDQEALHIADPAEARPTLGCRQPGRQGRRPERQRRIGQGDMNPPGPANSIQSSSSAPDSYPPCLRA